jgi:hypothetical protein
MPCDLLAILRGERPSKRRQDVRAPDGGVAHGSRLVRAGGKVSFAGTTWQSDLLLPLVGETVLVEAVDYWRTEVSIYRDGDFSEKGRIVTLKYVAPALPAPDDDETPL